MTIRQRLDRLERAARPALPNQLPADGWRTLIPGDQRGREIAGQFAHLLRPDWSALVRPVGVPA